MDNVPFSRPKFCNDYDSSEILMELMQGLTAESWEGEYLAAIDSFDFVLDYGLAYPSEFVSIFQFNSHLPIPRVFCFAIKDIPAHS